MIPTTMNLTFICDYIDGTVRASGESSEAGWFTPAEALLMVTAPHIKKQLEDMIAYGGTKCFASFTRDADGAVTFVNDEMIE